MKLFLIKRTYIKERIKHQQLIINWTKTKRNRILITFLHFQIMNMTSHIVFTYQSCIYVNVSKYLNAIVMTLPKKINIISIFSISKKRKKNEMPHVRIELTTVAL